MRSLRGWLARAAGVLSRPGADDDLRAELESHLEFAIAENVRRGMAPDAARRQALLEAGGLDQAVEAVRDQRGLPWLETFAADVRYAVRALARHPVVASVTILSLAAGIGSATAMLIVRDAVFVNPPPLYRAPGQLSRVDVGRPERPRGSVPIDLYERWAATLPTGASIAGASGGGTLDVKTDDREAILPVRSVTSEFFTVLGVDTELGRTFAADETDSRKRRDQPGTLVEPV
jgi:hypothetical protein